MKAFLGRYWHYLVVVAVTLLLNVLHVANFTEFSPVDESRHVDYIVHLTHGKVVALGDALHPETMRLEACRGIDLPGFKEPPCDAKSYVPPQFRDEGYNNAVNHPPLYYAVTAAPAWVADKLGAGSVFDPARLIGGLWLAIGLVLSMRAAELLGAKRLPLMGAAIALTVVPGIISTHATVNPDAAGIFAGGLVFLLAVLWEQGRVSTRWLVVAGVVAAGLKLTNLSAIAVVVLWFLVRAFARRRGMALDKDRVPSTRDARAYVKGAATLLLTAVVVSGVWVGIQGARASIDPLALESNRRFQVDHFPGEELFLPDNLFAMMPPLGKNTYVAEPFLNRLIEDVGLVALALALTAIIAWSLRFSVRDRLSTIGGATLLACLLGPTVFIVFSWITTGLAYGPSSRYAISMVPFVIVLLATLVRGRIATWGLLAYSFVAVGVTAGVLIHG